MYWIRWRNTKISGKLALSFIFLTLGITAFAQGSNPDRAIQHFEQQKYNKAAEAFEKLIQQYEKEPAYHYYLGRCYVHLNTDIHKAIPLLTFAGAKGKFSDTYFYLGLAYLYSYQFKEARTAFEKFPLFASRQDLRNIDIEQYKHYAQYGAELTAKSVHIDKASESSVSTDQKKALNTFSSKGAFISLPKAYQSFLWNNEKDEQTAFRLDKKLYFSSYNLRTRSNDLFVADESNEQSKLLSKTLASDADEAFAWYDEDNKTLYFSSKGFNSMGGYDIFKSRYDPASDRWTEPENLGFPINTPHDEVAFVYGASVDKALLLSDRSREPGKFSIYEITTSLAIHHNDEQNSGQLLEMARFNRYPNVTDDHTAHTTAHRSQSTSKNKSSPEDKTLYQALHYQLKADSFLRASEKKRSALKTSQSQKSGIYQEIEHDEAQWQKYQELADEYYSKLDQTGNPGSQKPANTEKKQSETVHMGIKPVQRKKQQKQSEFDIKSQNAYDNLDQIPMNEQLPDHLLYKVQLGVFSEPVKPSKFGGLTPVTAEYLEQKELTKYYCGKFVSYEDAYRALKKVKTHGFEDAYIISYYKGKKIPVSRAKDLEKTL